MVTYGPSVWCTPLPPPARAPHERARARIGVAGHRAPTAGHRGKGRGSASASEGWGRRGGKAPLSRTTRLPRGRQVFFFVLEVSFLFRRRPSFLLLDPHPGDGALAISPTISPSRGSDCVVIGGTDAPFPLPLVFPAGPLPGLRAASRCLGAWRALPTQPFSGEGGGSLQRDCSLLWLWFLGGGRSVIFPDPSAVGLPAPPSEGLPFPPPITRTPALHRLIAPPPCAP